MSNKKLSDIQMAEIVLDSLIKVLVDKKILTFEDIQNKVIGDRKKDETDTKI